MSPYLAEFIGTFFLVLMGEGIVAGILLKDSKAEGAGWLAISIGWGLAVTLAIYAVGEYSGAHINPAVTLSLAIKGDFAWNLVPGYMLSQVLGGFVGGIIVFIHYLPHWKKTENKDLKLGIFATGPAIKSTISNFISEAIGTFILIFGLLFIGTNEFTEGLNPLVVGGLITLIGLALGGTTGYAINPARDLGPRIAHQLLPISGKGDSQWNYAWIPVMGPFYGGVCGAITFSSIYNNSYDVYFWLCLISFIAISMFAIMKEK